MSSGRPTNTGYKHLLGRQAQPSLTNRCLVIYYDSYKARGLTKNISIQRSRRLCPEESVIGGQMEPVPYLVEGHHHMVLKIIHFPTITLFFHLLQDPSITQARGTANSQG